MLDACSFLPDDARQDAAVDALYARAFGPGRFAKAAARLREGNVCLRDQSFLTFQDQDLIGACRVWPVDSHAGRQALFLGPIAVDPRARGLGIGAVLVQKCVEAAQGQTIILVGDLSFFGTFGFTIVPLARVAMPGPVDPKRLLWRSSADQDSWPEGLLSVPRATSPAR